MPARSRQGSTAVSFLGLTAAGCTRASVVRPEHCRFGRIDAVIDSRPDPARSCEVRDTVWSLSTDGAGVASAVWIAMDPADYGSWFPCLIWLRFDDGREWRPTSVCGCGLNVLENADRPDPAGVPPTIVPPDVRYSGASLGLFFGTRVGGEWRIGSLALPNAHESDSLPPEVAAFLDQIRLYEIPSVECLAGQQSGIPWAEDGSD
jgi:hypothetical protein